MPEHARGKAGLKRRSADSARRRRPSRLRILIWSAEIVVLAAAVAHFLTRSRSARQDPPLTHSARTHTRELPAGSSVPPLDDRAIPLHGLNEVRAARLAPLSGLARGSAAARSAQVMVSREYGLPVEVRNTIGMHFRLIPPGTSLLGSPETESCRWAGEAQHVVSIPEPLYLGKYEVTQEQWRAVMSANPSHFDGQSRPVEEVSWYDCQRFLVALCEKENVPVGTYRLPLEAEWEYACRAGTGAAYCFGDDAGRLQEYADHAGNNDSGTAEAGQRLPNAYGLFDMHGNVWEWCADLFRERMTADGDTRNPAEQRRSVRGGNWHDPPENCRSANRCRLLPGSHGNLLGFRVVRSLPELTQAQNADGRRVRGEAAERPVGQGL